MSILNRPSTCRAAPGASSASAGGNAREPPAGGAPGRAGIFDPDLLKAALPEAIRKLNPRYLIKNPVMFVVEITAALVTLIASPT
jgi:K+-transporting ATPase ATPase B chain